MVAAYETLSEPGLRAAADAGGWSAGDALHRQQARAASSAAEAAKQAELLRRAEELARNAEARRHCKTDTHVLMLAPGPDVHGYRAGLPHAHAHAHAHV